MMTPPRDREVGSSSAPTLALLLLTALVAGGASGFAMDRVRDKFYVDPAENPLNPTPEQLAKYDREKKAGIRSAAWMNSAVGAAISGGLFGACFGLFRRSVAGTMLGLLVGVGAAGGLAGEAGVQATWYQVERATSGERPSVSRDAIIQSAYWVPVALGIAVASLAASWRLGLAARTLVGVVLGAVAAAFAYPFVATVAFPAEIREVIPPAKLSHCLAMALMGNVLIALVTWLVLNTQLRSPREEPAPT
jgi:hypothetical protein